MKWWRNCCCCCACWSPGSEKASALDDASSLIQHDPTSSSQGCDSEVQAFYVPRRHSSFNTSTYSTVSTQPSHCQSDTCSSSGDEDNPTCIEQRSRCWSTIPSTNATDVAALVSEKCSTAPRSNSLSNCRTVNNHEETESGEEPQKRVDDEIYGYLIFDTAYDEQEQRLTVFLDRVTGLPKKSIEPEHQQYSTFVRLSITSSRKHFLLSRTIKNSLNPVYKEEHVFHTNRSKWKSFWQTALKLSVFDCDRQGRHDAVGHTLLPLTNISDKREQHRLPLTPMSMPVMNIGQLLVSLFYSATQSRLAIHVIKARNLRIDPEGHKRNLRPLNKGKETFDTFVKVTLMCGGQKVKTNRSQVVPEKSDPMYNHKSDFVVPPTFLQESSVVITVIIKGVLGRSLPLGRVTAGPYVELANGTQTQWGRMVHDNRSVVQWRNLYL
ncbi:Synaptotagmin-15 like protein [Argiope bruennichi]|uniref:Synaptotagmin-15 like protein n=1 Tax=Argiope bruennichi TaxID=94029 RepID=A0A8T0E721_ARGBR|nr:Synaptotagmin-15 like protein [Argiope bruennichi]